MPTRVHGPFTIKKKRINTKIEVAQDDVIGVSATGLIDFGGAVLGIGAPILDADGDAAKTPDNYPAPDLRKNSLICQIGSAMFQGGVSTSFAATAEGTLSLFPNDGELDDNSREWTVFIYHTPVNEAATAPRPRKWTYRTVDGVGGIVGIGNPNIGYMPVAVELGAFVHVFYLDDSGKLRHGRLVRNDSSSFFSYILDGDGGGGGRVAHKIGYEVTAVEHHGAIHVFYFDQHLGLLRHAWSENEGTSWSFEIVDGDGGIGGGGLTGLCGAFNNALSDPFAGGPLHVFYYGSTDLGLGPGPSGRGEPAHDLRHAVFDGTSWKYEVIDGNIDADGRVNADVGQSITSIIEEDGAINVFYYDATNTNLRHARRTRLSAWQYRILDGSGDPNPDDPSVGQTRAAVGLYCTATRFDGKLVVFYHDQTFGNVRVGTGIGDTWEFAKLDGGGGPGGRTKAKVGATLMACISYSNQVSLFYMDMTKGNLRHAWRSLGSDRWNFEVLDGEAGPNGRIDAIVGGEIAAVATPNDPFATVIRPFEPGTWPVEVFYYDATNQDLRHARYE